MKTVFLFALLVSIVLLGCEKGNNTANEQYDATIVGFDLNCSTCILSFSGNVPGIAGEWGDSLQNNYLAVNLGRNDFKIGQAIRVKARKATNAELPPCITLNASFNYRNIYILDYENPGDAATQDTVEVSYKQCVDYNAAQCTICLDTVLSDSRCPSGGECIWAGEAIARFKIQKYNGSPVFVTLKEGVTDTAAAGYIISFIKLSPYPTLAKIPKPEDYRTSILIKYK